MQQVGRGFGVAHMLAGRLFRGQADSCLLECSPGGVSGGSDFYGLSIAAPQLLPR